MADFKKFKLKGKILEVEECKTTLQKLRGLMFRRQSKPLLFIFSKPTRQPIHSFFCKPFTAVWLNKGKIIDEKLVKPYCISIQPKARFTQLVEIPLEGCKKISDDNRKI